MNKLVDTYNKHLDHFNKDGNASGCAMLLTLQEHSVTFKEYISLMNKLNLQKNSFFYSLQFLMTLNEPLEAILQPGDNYTLLSDNISQLYDYKQKEIHFSYISLYKQFNIEKWNYFNKIALESYDIIDKYGVQLFPTYDKNDIHQLMSNLKDKHVLLIVYSLIPRINDKSQLNLEAINNAIRNTSSISLGYYTQINFNDFIKRYIEHINILNFTKEEKLELSLAYLNNIEKRKEDIQKEIVGMILESSYDFRDKLLPYLDKLKKHNKTIVSNLGSTGIPLTKHMVYGLVSSKENLKTKQKALISILHTSPKDKTLENLITPDLKNTFIQYLIFTSVKSKSPHTEYNCFSTELVKLGKKILGINIRDKSAFSEIERPFDSFKKACSAVVSLADRKEHQLEMLLSLIEENKQEVISDFNFG